MRSAEINTSESLSRVRVTKMRGMHNGEAGIGQDTRLVRFSRSVMESKF